MLKRKEDVVLKMLLLKRAKARLIWNKWLSPRIVLCNQFKYSPSWICFVKLTRWKDNPEDSFLTKVSEHIQSGFSMSTVP